MRLAFFGTSAFAVPALESLHRNGHEVCLAVCPPPKPQGRGRRLVPSPVENAARSMGLPVRNPVDPNSAEFAEELEALDTDACVLAAYGYILKPHLLRIPKHGFINLHPSLLPEYRGAAPIQRALLDGREETGVSVIGMTAKVDAGPVYAVEKVPIDPNETCGDLSVRLADVGASLLATVLEGISEGRAEPSPQDRTEATSAPKIGKDERELHWTEPARALHNRVRALSPEPAAWTSFRERRILVYRSGLREGTGDAPAGALVLDLPGIVVATGSGLLELVEVKPESGKVQPGTSLRNGLRPEPGERMGN